MLQKIIDWILYGLAGLDPASHAMKSINFFLYDTVKIMFMLFVFIAIVGFFRTYISPIKVRNWLSKKKYGLSNIVASTFGAITPFCSCSSIPIFLSFIKSGVPLGVTFSFLITSPLVNEYLVVLMLGFFGWKITALYVLSGMVLGVVIGVIMGKLGLEKYLEKDIVQSSELKEQKYTNLKDRLSFGIDESVSIIKKLWIWIIFGVGVGAVIHNYIPSEVIQSVISKGGLFTVPLATILGVPMYGSCAAIVPIAVVLFQKGVPLGTALSFMMATAALSFPEAIILRRAMKLKLILIFFGIVTLGIIFTGYLFNVLQVLL
jgi:uncharacterized membrane protein YraQ (UPF0718 family)